ncbi:PLC-like phosphodiesterase [Mrakia frigida]|uniref:PLC-like phosphodiesterase n=1 Tax=Mrakia frigida TaxID=29902 RepID=UPI003FCC26A7
MDVFTVCNGHAELCDKSYGNVTFVGAHDSYAVGTTNIAANQDHNVTQQLTDGIRMLQVQAHNASTGIRLCHSCLLLDAGLLSTYLTDVNTWAVANPTEVISILIVNSDGVDAATFGAAFVASGLDTISYTPPRSTTALADWPTLGSMIDSGKRIVTFMDHDADITTIPYIIDEFSNVFEDEFNTLSNAFPCIANRTTGDPTTQLMLTNHFLDVAGSGSIVYPDKENIVQTNSETGVGSLGLGAQTCAALHGRYPNFMLVDFYTSSEGAVFDVAASLNGVSAPTNDIAPYLAGTSSATTNTTTGSGTQTSVESLSGAVVRWEGISRGLSWGVSAVVVAALAGAGGLVL